MEPAIEPIGGNCIIGMKRSNLDKYGLNTALYLGKLNEDGTPPYPVFIDSLYPHVVFVCGTRGSGKSYTLGVLAEELIEKNPTVGVVIIDPIGVFWSMKSPNVESGEVESLKKWELEPKGYPVKVLVPEGITKKIPKDTYDKAFTIPVTDLTVEDWGLTFKLDRFDPTMLLLERALAKLGKKFTIDDLIEFVSSSAELVSKDKGFVTQTRRGLVSRLLASKRWGVISGYGTPLSEIVTPGRITVIDTSFLEESVANLVIGVLARKILEARKIAVRTGKGVIPPTWVLIDEAHTAIPSREKTAASDSIIEYVKQGRRPGCSIILATQQPSAVDSRVLSQLDVLITHKLVFGDDIDAVFKRMPTNVPKELRNPSIIRNLILGSAVAGDKEDMVKRAFIINVRPRKSQHEGRAIPTTESALGAELESEVEVEAERMPAITPLITIHQSEELANRMKEKKFLVFGHDEKIDRRKIVWWPLWKVDVGYPSEQFSGTIFFDAVTGAIMGAEGTEMLLELVNLKPIQVSILSSAQNAIELDELSGKVGVDKMLLKRHVKQLIEAGWARSWTKNDRTYYQSKKRFTFPNLNKVASNFDISNQPVKDTIDAVLGRDDVARILELWGTPRVRQLQQFYYPYWLYRFTNGSKRIVLIDGVTGEKSDKTNLFKHLLEPLF